MKNQIKYLFGLLFVGLGLSSCFGSNYYDVELVASQFLGSSGVFNADYSTSYSYLFRNDFIGSWIQYAGIYYNFFFHGYGLIYDNSVVSNRFFKGVQNTDNTNSCYNNVVFNSSVFGLVSYNGQCAHIGSLFAPTNFQPSTIENYSTSGDILKYLKFSIGESDQSGKVFIQPSIDYSFQKIPTYGFGNGFFSNNHYFTYNTSEFPRGARLFYNTTGNNVLNSIDFVGPTENQPSVYSWELFGLHNTLTKNGYINDTTGLKGRHFGSLGLGYSFVYNNNYSGSINSISRNDLKFTTVYDNINTYLSTAGGINLSFDPDFNYHYDGILALKKHQYQSNGNPGIILISKNPGNVKQLLFQEFSCNTNNIKCLFNGGNTCTYSDGNINNSSDFHCDIVSQGVLTKSGSSDILPFNDLSTPVSTTSGGSFVYYLLGSSWFLGNVNVVGNDLCFSWNSSDSTFPYCFTMSTGTESIKSYAQNGVINSSVSAVINESLLTQCLNAINDSDFEIYSSYLCDTLLSNIGSPIQIPESDNQYISVFVDDNGQLHYTITTQDDLVEQMSGYYRQQDENGNRYTTCPSCNTNNLTGSDYLYSGALSTGYYDFSNTGLFFKCPYPYTSLFKILDWDLQLGKFDIAGPINCFISAFNHGKTFTFLTNVGLYDFGPLIQGSTSQHNILFRFFDVVISLGLLLGLGLFSKIFK